MASEGTFRGGSDAGSALARRSILVVDDEPALCDMLARRLKRAGAAVTCAHTAAAALESVAASGFDIALLDKRLGNDDGVALIGKLLERQPALSIVIMTGFASVEDSLAALEAGAVGYLLKPFDSLDAVLRELEEVLVREERRRRATLPPQNVTATQSLRRQPADGRPARPAALALLLPKDGERILLQRALEERGFSVDRVAGMADLGEALGRRAYDAIVVDAELSGADGVAVLERARSMSRRAALVLVGTTPSLEVTTRLLRLGKALFVRRPIDSDVVGKIERAVVRHRDSLTRGT